MKNETTLAEFLALLRSKAAVKLTSVLLSTSQGGREGKVGRGGKDVSVLKNSYRILLPGF